MIAFTASELDSAERVLRGSGIVSPGISTYPKADDENKRIHAAMMQLAYQGRARLVKQSRHWCVWAPVEKAE